MRFSARAGALGKMTPICNGYASFEYTQRMMRNLGGRSYLNGIRRLYNSFPLFRSYRRLPLCGYLDYLLVRICSPFSVNKPEQREECGMNKLPNESLSAYVRKKKSSESDSQCSFGPG